MTSCRSLATSLLLATVATVNWHSPARAQSADQFRFQYIGPPSGGRISAAAGSYGDTLTYYLGAASGGVWKTTDGARTWTPIFDDAPVQAVGALAVAPSNSSIVWAGTGEAWAIRDSDMMGDGIYKSDDAGKTWTNVGLRETGRIARIIVHPKDPNIVFVCALGRATGPQEERGVYRTTDGGKTWARVLFVDPNTGCSGLTLDVNDPSTLFAATWEVVMHTWAMFSGGPGSGLYVSHDGGTSWTRVKDAGLPKSPIGKVDVAIAPSDSKRVYMLAQTPDQGSLWRSNDGGSTWRVTSWDRSLIGRAGYYIHLLVSPKNPDEVLVANSSMHRSMDGGLTFPDDTLRSGGCGDCHDIWWDLTNPDHYIVTGDGGAGITRNHALRFTVVTLPIAQNYHVAVDNRTPYWVYSNRQDDGTMRGPGDAPIAVPNVPSYARGGKVGTGGPLAPAPRRGADFGGGFGGGDGGNQWQEYLGGCESGFTIPDLANPDVVWATCYGNKVTRFDDKRHVARSVQPYMHTLDSAPSDVQYRCHWTAPIAVDPFDHNTVYYGCQVVFRTTNDGQSWDVISPDLSTRDPARITSSGGIVGDNLGQFYGAVVFALAPSPVQPGLIWAGTNDGQLWYTTAGGGNWINVTKQIVGSPVGGTVRKIEPSHFDAATAYVVVDAHIMDDRAPYIFKTTDFGKTWTKITGDIPTSHPLDYVLALAENPNRKGMLFAGTGHAFFYSLDDGTHWTQFQEGLPAAPVTWIAPQKQYHDVVISTYGRGLFILRDITRLEQPDQIAAGAHVQLLPPIPAVRAARGGSALIRFALKSAVDTVGLDILDAAGNVIRTMKMPGRAGMNRVIWELRYDPPAQIALRTAPPDNPHIWEEPRFKNKDTRPVTHWGIQAPQHAGPIVSPGTYTVRLHVRGETCEQPLQVIRDVELVTPAADLIASTNAQIRVRNAINTSVDVVNRLEVFRKRLEVSLPRARGARAQQTIRDRDRKALAIELELLSRADLHSDDKWFVETNKPYMNLVWLNGEIGLGASDMAGGADYRPTDASLLTLRKLEAAVARAKADFDRFMSVDVQAYDRGNEKPIRPSR